MPHDLFAPITLGDLRLPNRIVMAPLTRNRANLDGDTVTTLHSQYYAQRAGAGLIISEGTQISAEGKGYFRTPGIYTVAQVAAWKAVTDAVHEKGGRIFCQLWHTGRVSHTRFQPGGQDPVAPSAIRADAKTYAGDGMINVSAPRALATDEIPRLVQDYVHAANCAKQAGFDGIELHAANGYLIDQFFRTASNKRVDRYGGSIENRTRILKEILDGLTTVWDGTRIGVRFSPLSHAGGAEPDNPMPTYLAAIAHANAAGLAYMHVIEGETGGDRTMSPAQIKQLREAFQGAYMANNGYDRAMAMQAIDDGADLICFGVPYIANPDLAERLEANAPLNKPDQSTFYGGGAEGYTDYPFMTAKTVSA
jgi:N-ethylmaleimide reductase